MKIQLNCKICHEEIIGENFIVRSGDYSIVVCKKCHDERCVTKNDHPLKWFEEDESSNKK